MRYGTDDINELKSLRSIFSANSILKHLAAQSRFQFLSGNIVVLRREQLVNRNRSATPASICSFKDLGPATTFDVIPT